jgi:hypothetical protein
MVALMNVTKERRSLDTEVDLCNGEAVLENSPAGDSKANGFIERPIQELEGQVRTIKAATKRMIEREILR